MMVSRALIGTCDAFVQVSGSATIYRIVPEADLPKWMAGVESTRILGNLITPVIGTQLFTSIGFKWEFVTIGAMACAVCVVHTFLLCHAPTDVGNQINRGANASYFLSRPPIVAIFITIVIIMIPVTAYEPAIEPYLTSEPFNLTVEAVGYCFLAVGIFDLTGALASPLILKMYGQVGTFFAIPVFGFTAMMLLARGPQTLAVVISAFGISSFGVVPVSVAGSQLMMRVCRTYDLDPKRYSETISSTFAAVVTGSAAVFGTLAGITVEAIGFQNWVFISAWLMLLTPIVTYIGFNPRVMGRPLAQASDAQEALPAADSKKGKEGQ